MSKSAKTFAPAKCCQQKKKKFAHSRQIIEDEKYHYNRDDNFVE
jgi:hypothetical protein